MPKNNRHGQAAILTDSDYSRIRKYLQNPRHRLLFDILRYTGERVGAIVQLEVSDVYFDAQACVPHDWITFRSKTRKADPSGNRQTRQVPVNPCLKESLENFRYPPAAGWLFPARLHCEQHITIHGAAWVINRAIAKAGLDSKGISTHSFRRTLITKLHENGCDSRLIQEVTGHKDLRSLQRYIEIDPKRVKEAIDLV